MKNRPPSLSYSFSSPNYFAPLTGRVDKPNQNHEVLHSLVLQIGDKRRTQRISFKLASNHNKTQEYEQESLMAASHQPSATQGLRQARSPQTIHQFRRGSNQHPLSEVHLATKPRQQQSTNSTTNCENQLAVCILYHKSKRRYFAQAKWLMQITSPSMTSMK